MSTNHARDRRGCLTCRRRKKKCVFPAVNDPDNASSKRCPPCVRLNLRCEYEEERVVSPIHQKKDLVRRQSDVSSSDLVLLPQALEYRPVAIQENALQEHRRIALRYYVQSFAATLSTNQENNGFLSVLLPMAMESRPLLDALVAWSTSHLALAHDHLQVKALEDRSTALRSFATGLRQLSTDMSVAICLVLTSMESILGNTNDWYRHLSAAASMIRSTTDDRPVEGTSLVQTSEGRWLLRNFAYHDVLASVSLNREMLISDSADWLLLQPNEQRTLIDTYLGIGCAPVSSLARVRNLTRQLVTLSEDSTLSSDSREGAVLEVANKLQAIEAELIAWQPPSNVSDEGLLALAQSYRSAALLCLYRALRFHNLRSPTNVEHDMAENVHQIVRSMSQLPPGSLPECTLLFPLFVAGGETRNAGCQQAIADRMHAIFETRSFANVETALDVLKEVWDVQARTLPIDPARPYDWTCVLERRKWELSLS